MIFNKTYEAYIDSTTKDPKCHSESNQIALLNEKCLQEKVDDPI